ncbi:MAG: CDP-alcohol phosphatidyltransferase family protein [Actinomycetota bacterium]
MWPYRVALAGLYRIGAHAWHLTLVALTINVVCGWLLITDRHFLPGILLIPAGLFDLFDGGMARFRGEASRKGALLDATVDRVADAIIFGALYYSVATQGQTAEAALALSALVVSLLVSHVRAEGEAAGLQISEGVFARLERYLALVVGLTVPGALLPALAILTGLGTITSIQRTVATWRGLGSSAGRRDGARPRSSRRAARQ